MQYKDNKLVEKILFIEAIHGFSTTHFIGILAISCTRSRDENNERFRRLTEALRRKFLAN